jgi:ABC-type molybdate transport system substrate-binding protein
MRLIGLAAALCVIALPAAALPYRICIREPAQVRFEGIRVVSPGVISNSGLSDVADAFTRETGIKVVIEVDGMGTILKDVDSAGNVGDVAMLPMDLMSTLALDGGVVGDMFEPLGRVEIGLFAKPGFNTHPDISTAATLAAAMKTSSVVFYSDPASGSMQAGMSDRLLKRSDFADVHGQPVKGDAEPALKRGDGDDHAMGLGLIHGVHSPANTPTANPYLIGMLPAALDMHMDMAAAVPTCASNAKDAQRFIKFALSPAMRAVWQAKGVDRY